MEERRSAVRREALTRALVGLLGALAFMCGVGARPVVAASCDPAGFSPRGRVESGGVVVVYRTLPPAIEIGRHFTIEALVCTDGSPAVLTAVDADMPEHRHGMNYRPTVAATSGGRYVAEGLLFHMPGRWRLLFDVERGGRRARLATDVVVD